MGDMLAIRGGGAVWFASNSVRHPGEVQHVERHEAVTGDTTERLACTHIGIDQVADRQAVTLSRPDGVWGAEMGVNAAGVVVSHKAVHSRRVMKKGAALLGMDLVRLGLERSSSAHEAAAIIIHLLETHGQGGPAGWRGRGHRHDSNFLIADAAEILVLETCGREWRLDRVRNHAAISNAYSLEGPVTMASEGAPTDGFGADDEAWLRRHFGRATARRAAALTRLEGLETPGFQGLAAILRHHDRGDGFTPGSKRDLCQHHGGFLRQDHAVNAMLARLAPDAPPAIAITATKTPCISLFRPITFDASASLLDPALWAQGAARHDALARDPAAREQMRNRIAAAETHILTALEAGRADIAETLVAAWDEHDLAVGGREPDAPTVAAD
ncbi:carcinine hydrolase/isopenicillin-N N-acyltransferase family protein [Maricaulis maris]|uniref:Dipeptidase n=1 Tax=Maricaulis maris TaxID=74318 RepID=A0A495D2S8_9PROT|nr:carcinine hydrolase/isopenicillin-N N-acyltransferase family protein [Maricaulis maris]RKQ96078.1 dipeptidase [Maricaulis maris]